MKLLRQVWTTKNHTRQPAVFMDRDGTIIRFRNVIDKENLVWPLSGAVRVLSRFQKQGYLLVVITNQPNVEKKLISATRMRELHEHLHSLFQDRGVRIDAIYTCPHQYGSSCSCRKPGLGLIRAAQKDFNIDMKNSWLIGDSLRDIETGKRAKLKTILIGSGDRNDEKKFFNAQPTYHVTNILASARIVSARM